MAAGSRAIVVLGMHRSGTSAVARGLQALGVYLGDDFLDAQPENPTVYWEDRGIVELNERALKTLHLDWILIAPIERRQFGVEHVAVTPRSPAIRDATLPRRRSGDSKTPARSAFCRSGRPS